MTRCEPPRTQDRPQDRTYDRPPTLALLAEWAGGRYAGHPALRFKTRSERGGWETVSYAGLRTLVRRCGRRLLDLGTAAGDRVAILSETRPEWTCAHLAVLAAGAVTVPVYPTAGEAELRWVLSDSAASLALCENDAQAARVEALRAAGALPHLRHVLLLTDTPADAPAPHGAPLDDVLPLDDALAVDDALAARAGSVRDEDDAAIVYTSGTTGPPKGCRLTHRCLGATLDATLPLQDGGPGDRTYLYLPLAHLLAQLTEFSTLVRGGELCFFGGRIEDVVAELAEARPTHLPSVPRLFEKVHSAVLSLAQSQEGGRERFEEAVRIGVLAAEGRLPDDLRAACEEADERLYGPVREAFGGRLRWALTGAAPIAPATLDFLRACGIAVYEGYGMTESGGVISLNHPGAVRYGTVGRPIGGCEVDIADDGEILARGPAVFPGYHRDPEATAAVLDADGWLHTGDLGALDEDGFLTVTGRKKDLIITSSGKNLTPSHAELAIERAPCVAHAVLAGDRRPYPVALIAVDPDEVRGLGPDAVRFLVQQAVDAANATLSRPARVRAFTVLDGGFSVEGGELTPTLKVRRRAVLEKYADDVDRLYAEG
ncbi:AMP-dependent synthetase/ligase [Streptomyces sp. PR69]|uniref:AMP-dependent synthetase/ligase n=1 Tax=Streptomyces sp. PR69 TaxID=2984950 RepID=UPI0022653F4A|nr:long-chain fatty acid--CoA ligase [Streptomyces sp. PR69]